MSALPFWLALLLLPYWLGPIVVWMTQKWSVHPQFEPFDPTRHPFDQDLLTTLRQTREALVRDGFEMVADLRGSRARPVRASG